MLIKINKNFIIIFSFILLMNNLSQSTIDSFQSDKINKYKKEIGREIIKSKFYKYALLTAGTTGLGIMAYKIFRKPEIDINKDKFSDEEVKKIKDIINIPQAVLKTDNDKNTFFPYKIFNFLKSQELKVLILNSLFSSINLKLLEYIIQTFSYINFKHDIFWIVNKSDIYSTIFNLKENAVNLDPKSEVLSSDNKILLNNPEQFKLVPGLSELINLNNLSKARITTPLNDQQINYYIQRTKLLSNKLIDNMSYIIAFLNYTEDELISQDKFMYLNNLRLYIAQFTKITDIYRQEVKSILEQFEEKKIPNKSLLGVITSLHYSFNQVVTDTRNFLNEIF